jgi:hypothetical protein
MPSAVARSVLARSAGFHFAAVDCAVLTEVRDVDAAHEVAAPRLVGHRAGDARRRGSKDIAREPFGYEA